MQLTGACGGMLRDESTVSTILMFTRSHHGLMMSLQFGLIDDAVLNILLQVPTMFVVWT